MKIILTTDHLPFSWSSIFCTSSEPDYCPWWPSGVWSRSQAGVTKLPQVIRLLAPELNICHRHPAQENAVFSSEALCFQVCPPWLSPRVLPSRSARGEEQKCGCFPTLRREPRLIRDFGGCTLKQLSKWTIQTSGEAAAISLVLQQIHGPSRGWEMRELSKGSSRSSRRWAGPPWEGPSQGSLVLGTKRKIYGIHTRQQIQIRLVNCPTWSRAVRDQNNS